MPAPEFPSRTDVRPGTNAIVIDEGGMRTFRCDESSSNTDPEWTETRRYEHDDLGSISLGTEGVEPPVLGEFSVVIEIDAPIQPVFDFVADIETHPIYADFVERVEIVSDARRGEDVVFEQVHQGSTESIETEFVTYEPNERLAWVTHKSEGDLHINYWFEPTDAATRVYHAGIMPLNVESPQSFSADLGVLMERYENNEAEMVNLKSILEGRE